MYKHILIPSDGSAVAERGVAAGIEYAREAGASVTFFTAVPEYQPPSEGEVLARAKVVSFAQHEQNSKRLAETILAPAVAEARGEGVVFSTDYALCNQPWEAIVEAAKRHECDAIFMGSHRRKGLARLIHGSQAIDVLSHSDIPTLVVR
jgi:nucleotide-binding universal stress UspA family protein